MAAGLTTKTTGDGNSGTITSKFLSSDATNTGALRPAVTIYKSDDTEIDWTTGTAGSPAGGVTSVQGVASMTPLDVNFTKVVGAAIAQGHGVAATALRVELPTDGTGVVGLIAGSAKIGVVTTDQTTHGTTDLVAADITKVAGAAISQGHGTAAAAIRVELPTDGTGVVGLIAGSAKVGVVTTDQTTHGTTDLVAADLTKIAGTAILTGNGAAGPGSQRVTIASDNSAVPVSSASLGFDVGTTITRPANTTAYTGGDVLGGALDLGVLGTSAASVQIVGVQLEADIAAIPAGQTSWTLHLYNVTPPSAVADNGVFDLPSGDRASYLGNIALTTLIDLGSTLYMESNNIFKPLKLSGTHIFAYLVTVGGFTPAANSEVYKLTLHTMVI